MSLDPESVDTESVDTESVDPDLARLAERYGVATSYEDHLQRHTDVGRDAVVAVLGALGVDATSPEAVRASLAAAGASPPQTSDAGAGPGRLPERTRRGWGWAVQLYAMRSHASWGIGDLGDLATLVTWTAEHGGDLLLVNPLHAVTPPGLYDYEMRPMQPSPYFPASRRWTNPLYLRVDDTAAYREAPAELRATVDLLKPELDPDRIDRDAAWRAKVLALELLFQAGADAGNEVLPDEADDVWTFATWCVLCEFYGGDWREWPEEFRRPDGPAVAEARDKLADRVRFHVWLQIMCDQQLARVQTLARDAGMDVGVVHDLAVGIDPAGADAWMLQDALVLGARVGVPPDAFNQQGQNWGMPPWHPARLAELAYAPLRDMLRALLRHSGGVRIDHVLGMFRTWWVPDGSSPRDGTYVQYDADALLGVVVDEAVRANAVVIGEDLGTVPEYVRDGLRERGVLGCSVLWFEREKAAAGEVGALTPVARWREAATASVTTHDLPTALGWLRGEHIRVRASYGQLDDPEADARAWEEERRELLDHLVAAGALGSVDEPEDVVVRAMHRYLAMTPSRYVLASLADAVGDLRQPNLPGTVDEYPNWRLPIADSEGQVRWLDDLLVDPRVDRLAEDLSAGVR